MNIFTRFKDSVAAIRNKVREYRRKKDLARWLEEHSRESRRSGPASFLGFPAETRNQIYEYFLLQIDIQPHDNGWGIVDDSNNGWNDILALAHANTCKKVRKEILSLHAHRFKRFAISIDNFVQFMHNCEEQESLLLGALAESGSMLTIECNRIWTHDLNILPTLMALRKLPTLKIVLEWSYDDSKDLTGLTDLFETARNSAAWLPDNLAKLSVTAVVLQKQERWCCPKQHVSRCHLWNVNKPVIRADTTAVSGDWSQEHAEMARQVLQSLGIKDDSEEDSFSVTVNIHHSEAHFEWHDWMECQWC